MRIYVCPWKGGQYASGETRKAMTWAQRIKRGFQHALGPSLDALYQFTLSILRLACFILLYV
jgi:hypothetical protein